MDMEHLVLPSSAYLIAKKEKQRQENIKNGKCLCLMFVVFTICFLATAYYLSYL